MAPALDQTAHFSDVALDVAVELDRRILTLREILLLEPGSLVKLPRSAGENIDLLVGGARIGSGEIVIIEETLGIRITDFVEED